MPMVGDPEVVTDGVGIVAAAIGVVAFSVVRLLVMLAEVALSSGVSVDCGINTIVV